MTPQEAFVLISSRTACVDFDLDFDRPLNLSLLSPSSSPPSSCRDRGCSCGKSGLVETRFEPGSPSGPTPSRDAVVVVCWMSGEMSNLDTWR